MDIAMSMSRFIHPYLIKSISLDPGFIILRILINSCTLVVGVPYLQLPSQLVA